MPAEFPNGFAQRGPFTAAGFQEAYFVFREADDIEVFICSDAALPRRLDQLIERPKSLPVTVQNSGPSFRAGETGAGEVGGVSGKRVFLLHDSAMRPRSRPPRPNAKTICPQVVHTGNPRRESNRPRLAAGLFYRKPLA